GAVPVFCDIDPATFLAGADEMRATIDREFRVDGERRIHRASGAKLAALMPVHLYGRACSMAGILELARETGTKVIEDAAQAIDSRDGARPVGSFGDTGSFSFYPTKNLGGPGDGGLVTCEDPALAARLVRLRSHGSEPGGYEHAEAGINARMSEFVAAVLNAKLAYLDAWTARRRALAALYSAALAEAAARGLLELPAPCDAGAHVWHQYAIRIPSDSRSDRICGNSRRDRIRADSRRDGIAGEAGRDRVAEGSRRDRVTEGSRRDRLMALLEEQGIATRVFYPLPLHLQPCFAGLGGKPGDLAEAEAASREVLCLPIYPSLDDDAALGVAAAVVTAAEVASS
ncbi:MAG: DegT/DnrJ/EryC1/StrS family aminotransferase, partial [Candidatus Binatia bacterium]